MRIITNVCQSCRRENVPDNEYLPTMSLCGDCVASQISQTREQMNQMQDQINRLEQSKDLSKQIGKELKQLRDQVNRLEQSKDLSKQIGKELKQLRDQVNRLEQSRTRNTPPVRESSPPKGYVLVEGGSFQMGSPASEKDCDDDEGPVHSVTISSFYMKTTPVTQREWRELMGDNPSGFKGDDLPVETVSWFDVVEYCNVLSRSAGRSPVYRMSGDTVLADWSADGFRLPTEAEWEYAARGGALSEGYRYSGGSNVDTVGWYDGNSGDKTHPVGRKRPNELGLYDMSGNVWEWCLDWYDSDYYSSSPDSNPTGPSSGSDRVVRGGTWLDDGETLRSASRHRSSPGDSGEHLGFRLVFRT